VFLLFHSVNGSVNHEVFELLVLAAQGDGLRVEAAVEAGSIDVVFVFLHVWRALKDHNEKSLQLQSARLLLVLPMEYGRDQHEPSAVLLLVGLAILEDCTTLMNNLSPFISLLLAFSFLKVFTTIYGSGLW
jgi:hypothetical protein